MKQAKPIIWGIAIIALGVIFGGNAIGLFNFNVFFDGWWTLFIIVPSVISLIFEKEKLYLLFAYPKNVQEDLTEEQRKAIRLLIEAIKKE